MRPPSQIDGAVVLEWAWSDLPFGVVPYPDGSVAFVIHGLAICQYAGSHVIYRFSCDACWECQQDVDYDSVATAKTELPAQYRHAPIHWQQASNPALERTPTAGDTGSAGDAPRPQ